MKRLSLISLVVAFSLLRIPSIYAEIKLPAIVSSNMVLQRNTTVVLWGWADAKEKVSINTSWSEETRTVEADKQGNWRIEVKTTNSKEAQTIHIKSKTSDITLENVLFGEVWLCSGQSNMEQPLKGWEGQPVFGSAMAITKSKNPDLRLFTVNRQGSKSPLKDLENYHAWQEAGPENVLNFSAIAYFFGQQLQEILDCPVGIIHSSYAGSSIQAWMSHEVISSFEEVDRSTTELTVQACRHAPTVLFNAMINPLLSYRIKGALWYQAEENRRYPESYKALFPAMVKDWRTRWGIGDFPFYYVQIAPYIYRNNNEAFQSMEHNSAFIREVQLQCAALIPNSGIAITMDLGHASCIHPPQKKEVADRLLFIALSQSYGYKTIDAVSPVYDSMTIKDGGIILSFKNAENGLYTYDQLKDFEIAGDDRVFYPADAGIGKAGAPFVNSNEVFVKSDQVPNPVAVRYAWRNFVVGSLFDTNFLPASSFRTDDWDEATRVDKQLIINHGSVLSMETNPDTAKKIILIAEHNGPVIDNKHKDVLSTNNLSGFETGQVVKLNGVYHMFVNEMFDRPHKDLRIAYWTSSDAVSWERQSTIVESIPGRSPSNPKSEVWVTGVEFNEEEDAWNIFYVAYRSGDKEKGEFAQSDYQGRIWRAKSVISGKKGISGPYADMGIVLQPDENSQEWEGQQAVATFNPYKAGDKWYAFYDGHNYLPKGPWPVGLATAAKLRGPWTRMPEGINPLPIAEEFIENPQVTELKGGGLLAVFDSFGDQEIAYSVSDDGINWSPECRVNVQSDANLWAQDGDHAMRTPLCAIEEDDGTFTILYTAMMKLEGDKFYALGKCSLAWK